MGRQVYPYRGRWLPVLLAAIAVPLAVFGARGAFDLFEWRMVAAGFLFVGALLTAWTRWRGFVLQPDYLELRGQLGLGLCPRIWFADGASLHVAHDEARLTGSGQRFRIGPEVRRWRELVAALQARLPALPASEPVTVDELAEWLDGRTWHCWALRSLTETGLALLGSAALCGLVVAAIYALTIGPELLPFIPIGIGCGLACMAAPALLWSLPLHLTASPAGLTLEGMSRWRARRRWSTVSSVARRFGLVRLETEAETLFLIGRREPAERIASAAANLLTAQHRGRAPLRSEAVPDAALSRMGPVEAGVERGLSQATR